MDMGSSASMDQPAYENHGEQPPASPENPTWAQTGTYVTPEYHDLSASGIPAAPGTALPPMAGELSEENYAPGRASGADVDRHIYTVDYHGPSYGELGPRPFPN